MPPGEFFRGFAACQEAETAGLRALRQHRLQRVGDLVRFGEAAGAELGLGHRPFVGADHRDPVGLQGREVPLRGRMQPHPHVHGRGDQDRQGGGEQDRRGEVRRVAGRHPGHHVGGGRRHHDGVGVAGEPDMADLGLALPVEQVGMGPLARERRGGERRDEFLRRLGQQRAHRRPPVAQAPDQVERLVGGDAAADDEEDAAPAERAGGGGRATGHGRSTKFFRAARQGERPAERPPQSGTFSPASPSRAGGKRGSIASRVSAMVRATIRLRAHLRLAGTTCQGA